MDQTLSFLSLFLSETIQLKKLNIVQIWGEQCIVTFQKYLQQGKTTTRESVMFILYFHSYCAIIFMILYLDALFSQWIIIDIVKSFLHNMIHGDSDKLIKHNQSLA